MITKAQQSKLYTQQQLDRDWNALNREHKFNLPSEPGCAKGVKTGGWLPLEEIDGMARRPKGSRAIAFYGVDRNSSNVGSTPTYPSKK